MARNEFERIARLTAVFGSAVAPDIGIGDDCAVLHPAGVLLATVDAAIEGVHFRRDLLTLEEASNRAIEAAASDIAAMGGGLHGPGCGLLLAWTLPDAVTDDDFDALARGARRAADRLATQVLGGNLSSAPVLSLTTTVLGRAGRRVVSRGGAVVGDHVAVSGPVGAAALGLRAVIAGRGDDPRFAPFVERWRSPRARVDVASELAIFSHAAVDLSDGLAQDASHLARASRCAIVLHVEALPMLEGQAACARLLGLDAASLALTGGEDYELLATGPREAFGSGWTLVGEVVNGSGLRVLEGGFVRDADTAGWDHFAR